MAKEPGPRKTSVLPGALSRRERQILDILYQRARATAHEVREALPGSPSYSTARALLRILEEKGHVRHVEEDGRYVYLPAVSRGSAGQSALQHLVQTFFDGSAAQVMAALLDRGSVQLPPAELERLAQLVDEARKGAHQSAPPEREGDGSG
ncbi:MAG: BlaI/MecI/CopY family transcriptional regulator [Acidobacteria bacterium]|nr:BlaI/MecI/CopY family transcriptional regulator [Acidobacteriota bacterium]